MDEILVKYTAFDDLCDVNVKDRTANKNGLTYLTWSSAWRELKKRFPTANYVVYENEQGWNYHTDNRTCWVKVGVTIQGLEHIEYLPVMDFKNKSIPMDQVTSMDVNKAIQRAVTKAIARHGLGLDIYAGEDLPEEGVKPAEAMALSKILTDEQKTWIQDTYGVTELNELTGEQYGKIMRTINDRVLEKEKEAKNK